MSSRKQPLALVEVLMLAVPLEAIEATMNDVKLYNWLICISVASEAETFDGDAFAWQTNLEELLADHEAFRSPLIARPLSSCCWFPG